MAVLQAKDYMAMNLTTKWEHRRKMTVRSGHLRERRWHALGHERKDGEGGGWEREREDGEGGARRKDRGEKRDSAREIGWRGRTGSKSERGRRGEQAKERIARWGR